ncbi:MAG: 5-oxoprolinase subunit PxpA [Pseudomonadota bacterium]|nr:5-oxoprolinase subunit PxpA [Pseudomonadota bacterium]
MKIDLNADLGESFGPWVMGHDDDMLGLVTSANVACGGHAGDPETMFATLTRAAALGVSVGAHPGYADRQGFGRRIIPMSTGEITRMVTAQIGALVGMASLAGARVAYVKPHGALSNLASRDAAVSGAICDAVAAFDPALAFLAISGTQMEHVAKARGLTVYSEIFADRAYQDDGQLVPRGTPGAVLHDADEAADRLVGFLKTGRMPVLGGGDIALDAHSICVHGDNPAAVDTARQIRAALAAEGVTLAPFLA